MYLRNRFLPALLAGIFACQAQATVTIIQNDSSLNGSAAASVVNVSTMMEVTDTDGPISIDYTDTTIPSNFGDNLNLEASVDTGVNSASAMTSASMMISILAPDSAVNILHDFSVSTFAETQTVIATGLSNASALLSLIFDIDMPYNYSFSTSGLTAMDQGSVSLVLLLEEDPTPIFTGGTQEGTVNPSFSGVISAGRYMYTVHALSNSTGVNGTTSTGAASGDTLLSLTPVPLPPAVLLMVGALGVLGAFRKRTSTA